jgi:hypothetical protein
VPEYSNIVEAPRRNSADRQSAVGRTSPIYQGTSSPAAKASIMCVSGKVLRVQCYGVSELIFEISQK